GIITVLVALLVPAMGGIVEVVLSIGALTGVPLYGPAVWALFSQRQTAFSILFTTLFSLCVNAFFKFLGPVVLDVGLTRMQETVLGVALPIVVLAVFELIYRKRPYRIAEAVTAAPAGPSETTAQAHGAQQSRLAIRTVAYALLGVGTMIFVLGLMAESGRWSVL